MNKSVCLSHNGRVVGDNTVSPTRLPGEEGVWIWIPSRMKNKTCQRPVELLVRQPPSISHVQLCLQPSSCSWVTFFEGWCQDLNSSHRKTLHSAKPTNTTKIENTLSGSTSSAAAIHREAHRMRGLGQSLRDPHSLMIGGKARGKLPGSDYSGVCRGGAEG